MNWIGLGIYFSDSDNSMVCAREHFVSSEKLKRRNCFLWYEQASIHDYEDWSLLEYHGEPG